MADNYDIYLTNNLSLDEKMKFYNSVMDNNLELFKALLLGEGNKQPYDIFEEVSAAGYKWTVFHYAMHYAKWDIINYIIEYLQDHNLIDIAFKMKTNDKRCPMLCLLKSNALNIQQKRDIYFKIVNKFQIPISEEVIKEANNRNLYEKSNNNSNSKNPYIKNELTINEKKNFYNSVINGDLDLFKSYIYGNENRKPYHIFEEVSEPGYNWTVFHYAMHYGKREIIKFIIEYLSIFNLLDIALNIKSKDGRCPLLCLLKSNNLEKDEKKEIFSTIIENYNIPISDEVRIELVKRKMDDILIKKFIYLNI